MQYGQWKYCSNREGLDLPTSNIVHKSYGLSLPDTHAHWFVCGGGREVIESKVREIEG